MAICIYLLNQFSLWRVFWFINQKCHYSFWYHIIHGFSNRVEVGNDKVFNDVRFHVSTRRTLAWIIVISSFIFCHVRHMDWRNVFLHVLIYLVVVHTSNELSSWVIILFLWGLVAIVILTEWLVLEFIDVSFIFGCFSH